MTISISALYSVETYERLLSRGLEIAAAIGLPVTTWRAGDPTKSLYQFLAEILANYSEQNAEYIKGGFLSVATGDWLKVLALEVYGVEAPEASYATPTVEIENEGGAYYEIDAGDLTFKASSTDKTYHNTDGGALAAGATLTLNLIADEPGADSSVADDEIDELVTTLLGVVVNGSTAATAVDEASTQEIRDLCLDTLGALSPSGPADAYEYVCKNSDLTGVFDITRAKTIDDSDEGEVTIYVASATGAVAGDSVTAAQNAVEEWATPLCITPTVTNGTALPIDVTLQIAGANLPAEYSELIESAIVSLFASINFGETISLSSIVSAVHQLLVDNGASGVAVTLVAPASPVVLANNQVPTLDDLAVTEV